MRALLLLTTLFLAGTGCSKSPTSPTPAPPPPPPPPPPAPTVQSVVVAPGTALLVSLGQTTALGATVQLSNGQVGTQTPTWTSSNPAAATVAGGTVTAVGNGQATITAAVGAVSGSATVTVAQAAASVRLLPADTVIKSTAQLRGAVLDALGNVIANAPLQWASLTPAITAVNGSGALTPQSTGVARIRVSSGALADTALVRTVWNVTQLSTLFPLFEYSASSGQRRVFSDVSQNHADARGALVGPAWTYFTALLPNNGSATTDIYFTTWPQIWTEVTAFCGGTFFANQTAWTRCLAPHWQHFLIPEGASDSHLVQRFLSRQFLISSYTSANTIPWFIEGVTLWLGRGTAVAGGIAGQVGGALPADFRTGDNQNRLEPLTDLTTMPQAEFFTDIALRTPVAVRMAQSAFVISYLASTPGGLDALCNIFAAIRAAPGNVMNNNSVLQIILARTGMSLAQIETAYLAHARAVTGTGGTLPPPVLIPTTCTS